MSVSSLCSSVVAGLQPYVLGEQPRIPGLVKLNTNENPYGPSPKAIAAMQAELGDSLRLYPDPNSDRLKQAVADYYGVSTAEVFVGNGSDEVLAHAFHGLFQHGKPLLFEGAITEENRLQGTLPLGQLALTTEVENYAGFPTGDLKPFLTTAIDSERAQYMKVITSQI